MSDPQDLLRRYLAQREAAGEGPLFLDSPWVVEQRGEQREAARMDEVDGERVRSDEVGRGPTRPDEAKRAVAPPKDSARGKGKTWSDELPEIPGAGIVVPAPSSDLFSTDELGQRDLNGIAELVRESYAGSSRRGTPRSQAGGRRRGSRCKGGRNRQAIRGARRRVAH